MSDVRIQIGTFERDYDLYVTTAPKDYDSASTITVYTNSYPPNHRKRDEPDRRFILVERDMIEWHRSRYASGLYRFDKEEVDGTTMVNYIAGKPMERIHQEVPE